MKAISVGRIVTKIMGREAGLRAVVTQIIDRNFVEITGGDITEVKRRRVNINHIEPSDHSVNISSGADDGTVSSAVNADNDVKEFMSTKVF